MTEDEKKPQTEETVPEPSPEQAFAANPSGEKLRVRRLGRAPGQSPRRRSPVNAIDVIIIIVVLALVAFGVTAALFGKTLFGNGTETKTIEYTVVFRQVNEEFITSISNGDTVLDAKKKQTVGVVSADVENTPSSYVTYLAATEEGVSGKAVLMTYPDRMDLTVTIRVDAEYRPGTGYEVGGLRIAVGSEYSMMFPGFVGSGVCIALNDNIS